MNSNPFLYELGRLEAGWHQLGNRLSFWNRLLTGRASELDSVVAHLDQLSKTWEQTLKLAHSSGAPPAVLQRAQDVIATINQTHEEAERQLAQVLTLQNRVAEQDRRVSAARASLEQTRREIIDHLLVQDSPPIWSAAVSSSEGRTKFRTFTSNYLWELSNRLSSERPFLCHDVLRQIPEKAFGDDQAPPRTAVGANAASRCLLAWERLLRL